MLIDYQFFSEMFITFYNVEYINTRTKTAPFSKKKRTFSVLTDSQTVVSLVMSFSDDYCCMNNKPIWKGEPI